MRAIACSGDFVSAAPPEVDHWYEGTCGYCGLPTRPRNARPLALRRSPRRPLTALALAARPWNPGASPLQRFGASFQTLLCRSDLLERAESLAPGVKARFRSVAGIEFHELVGPSDVDVCVVRAWTGTVDGWVCPECRGANFGHHGYAVGHDRAWGTTGARVKRPTPSFVVTRSHDSLKLFFQEPIARELSGGKLGARSNTLSCVRGASALDPRSVLRPLDIQDFLRRMGRPVTGAPEAPRRPGSRMGAPASPRGRASRPTRAR